MTDELTQAYLHAGGMAHEYTSSIGKTDLTEFTGDEWLTFCECVCKNYEEKINELKG